MRKYLICAILALSACGESLSDQSVTKQTQMPDRLVVDDDRGGWIRLRQQMISELRKKETPVEIRGRCLSACTMYLALPTTCIHPGAILGFHGPSFLGSPLPEKDFEAYSKVMAEYYPPGIRHWFMTESRYEIGMNFSLITGAEAIRHGVRAC